MRLCGSLLPPFVLAVSAVLAADFDLPDSKSHPLRLWYSSASSYWNDSLPIGNGRLGGMVKGDASTEIIYINEDSLWAGGAMSRLNPSSQDSLAIVQQELLQGDVDSATLEAKLGLSGLPSSMREFMPGGDFQIVYQNQDGSLGEYERWLDLETGTAGVYFTKGDVTYENKYFVSHESQVMGIRLSVSEPGALSFYIKFQRPSNSQNRFAEAAYAENGDTIVTKILENQIEAYFVARVNIEGGKKRQVGDQIYVSDADEAWIYIDMETSVRHPDPLSVAKKRLSQAMSTTYSALVDEHLSDYLDLFGRVSLSLGDSSDVQKAMSTDERLSAIGKGGWDPDLVALYFQYGRYLLISSSRPGSFPANLQGLWNHDLDPAWGSKYTININLQMNYWPAEVTNLPELTEPLFSLIEKMYSSGKSTARTMYGANGWCAHHNTDIWGDTAPQDIWAAGSYWPMGGAWLLQHVFEHYLFTGDKDFLSDKYYLLKDSARFYLDFLSDYKGWKVTNPSVSPENSYKNGSTGSMTIGSTIDNSILWELFGNVIDAADIVGKGSDKEFLSTIESMKSKLPPLRVSPKTGALMEWIEDFTESDPGHRHMSPLYGLYPGHEITPDNSTIWDAATALVKRRLDNGAGTSMGWSRAWITALHARLFDAASVEKDLTYLLSNLTHRSLLDKGDPAGFQIDGNFGGCASIAEALLQSHNDLVVVLPALPPSSTSGSFSGLVARGGFVVDAYWKDGLVTNITVESRQGNILNLKTGANQKIASGDAHLSNSTGSTVVQMPTEAGKTYMFTIGS